MPYGLEFDKILKYLIGIDTFFLSFKMSDNVMDININ